MTLPRNPAPIWTLVIAAVAAETGVARAALLSASRLRPIAEARQMAMAALRAVADLSYPETGRRLGDRDHTTVLFAEGKVAKRVAADWAWASRMARIHARVHAMIAGRPAPDFADVAPPEPVATPGAARAARPALVPLGSLVAALAAETGVSRQLLLSPLVVARAVDARRLAAFVLVHGLGLSAAAAGRRLGRSDQMIARLLREGAERVAADWDWASRLARVLARLAGSVPAAGAAPAVRDAMEPALVPDLLPPVPPAPSPTEPAPPRRFLPTPLTRTGARIVVRRPPPGASYDFGDPPPDLAARRAAAGYATSGRCVGTA